MAGKLELIPRANQEIIESSGVYTFLKEIRPHWQSKNLIQRVSNILPVDPSSACQRLFNAAVHDLREKIAFAGIDLAIDAANKNGLPPIRNAESLESYSTKKLIDLAYRIGLLTRPDYRKLLRAYDIRKDLEHEDDEYEAGIEDCVYIFKTCIDIVLSKDPLELIKLTDVKAIVESTELATFTESLLEEFKHAPEPRQLEILRFLISSSLKVQLPDVVRHNCYLALMSLRNSTMSSAQIICAREFVERIGKRGPTLIEARIAYASGVFPYLKKSQIKEFFATYLQEMNRVGHWWSAYNSHGELLRNLEEIGGLEFCPVDMLPAMVEWLVLCHIGSPGGRTQYGNVRQVFYSNIGAPISLSLLKIRNKNILGVIVQLQKRSEAIKQAVSNEQVARRFHSILDNIE